MVKDKGKGGVRSSSTLSVRDDCAREGLEERSGWGVGDEKDRWPECTRLVGGAMLDVERILWVLIPVEYVVTQGKMFFRATT